VTGADEGLGNGIVHGFLKRGAKVAAGLLDAARSASNVQPALPLQMDLTQTDQCALLWPKRSRRSGGLMCW